LISAQYAGNVFGIHSLADPANVGPVGTLTAPENVNIYSRSFISDGLLHLSTEAGRLLAYDIADPLDIELVGVFEPKDEDGNQLFDLGLGINKFASRGASFAGREFMIMVGRLNGQANTVRDITIIPLPLFPDAVKATSLAEVGGAWKRNTIALTSLALVDGYITLSHEPRSESKAIVSVAQGVDLVFGRDYTVDRPNKRIVFEPDMLLLLTELFNEFSTVDILVAYFAQN
jgi:hypothetical protein